MPTYADRYDQLAWAEQPRRAKGQTEEVLNTRMPNRYKPLAPIYKYSHPEKAGKLYVGPAQVHT